MSGCNSELLKGIHPACPTTHVNKKMGKRRVRGDEEETKKNDDFNSQVKNISHLKIYHYGNGAGGGQRG